MGFASPAEEENVPSIIPLLLRVWADLVMEIETLRLIWILMA